MLVQGQKVYQVLSTPSHVPWPLRAHQAASRTQHVHLQPEDLLSSRGCFATCAAGRKCREVHGPEQPAVNDGWELYKYPGSLSPL